MVRVNLKGVFKVTSKGKDYYYAWRGGPRLRGKPGSPEFIASYNEAIESRRIPDATRFRSLVVLYKGSGDYKKLADSTRRNWAPWLDRISQHFGDLSIAQFDRPEKIRPIIRRWRNKWEDKPRAADYGMQVLSRVLSYAVDPLGKIASNPCEGIKQLYSVNRSEIIWTDADIAELKKFCSPEIAHVVDLAAHTGLRLGDLLRLSWSHIKEDRIEITTGKSKHLIIATIPLYDDLQAVLARIPKRSPRVLTNSRHRPWRWFGTVFTRAKIAASMNDRNLHFHDLRGTAATRFYNAGLSERVIAEIMGWEEEHVARIIRRYVDRSAATKELIRKLNLGRKEN
jgi:integrase